MAELRIDDAGRLPLAALKRWIERTVLPDEAFRIKVGNSETAATPGTVTSKIEVFDARGNSLGYLPVYDDIT